MAESLVDTDPRIPPRFPTRGHRIHTTEGAVVYHRDRADIIRNILVDVVTAYNIVTGGHRRIPQAPPRPPVIDEATESSSEEY